MATNLLDGLKALVTPQLLGAAASRLGESESAVAKGLGAAIPLILAALLQKLRDSHLVAQIMSLLTSRANDPEVIVNPRLALPGEPSSAGVTDLGNSLLSTLFAGRTNAATNALADYAGIKTSSASSLMTLASTLITGSLGERVRRDGLTGASLASLLGGQQDGIINSLPGTLSNAGGLGSLREVGSRASAAVHDVRRQNSWGWLWAAAAALLLAFGAWALWGTREVKQVASSAGNAAQQARQVAGDGVEAAGNAAQQAGEAVGDTAREWELALARLGSFSPQRLPTNIEISIPEHGVERQIIAFLEDPSKQTDPVVWFNFDRLLFETGSATLRPESKAQLKNVAEILKAYPTTKIKIGGYTDTVGDPAFNLKLSQDRATSVMNALVGDGISPGRLSAEGYGETFPVADNSTAEGRQQNRRIAMRVTEK